MRRTRALVSFLASLLLFLSTSLHAAERDEAEKAAKEIMALLGSQSYLTLWDTYASQFVKDKVTRDTFLTNMSAGRAPLGRLTETKLVDSTLFDSDPGTGLKGRIYAFNFQNTYPGGKFYERIVVVMEADGRFRFTGFGYSPASK